MRAARNVFLGLLAAVLFVWLALTMAYGQSGQRGDPLFRAQGTWTPTITGQTTAGVYAVTGAATYNRLGNVVLTQGAVTAVSQTSAGSGLLQLGGLPYTASATHGACTFTAIQGITHQASYLQFSGQVFASTNIVFIKESGSNLTDTYVNLTQMTVASVVLIFTCTYSVAP